jgi:outer membrane immunogenic protein
MKKVLLAAVAMTLAAGSATASDLPVGPPLYRVAPPLPIYSWTGCYIGVNVGGLRVRKDYTASAIAGVPIGAALGSHDASGVLGGVQGGCNYQVAGFVFGVEADFDLANAEGSHPDQSLVGLTDRSRTRSLGSVTGRLGYAFDRLLGYVKAGGAGERDEYDAYLTGTTLTVATASETRSGWTAGAGLEFGITYNLWGFVEYDYYGFGTHSIAFAYCRLPPASIDIRESKQVVKAGLNWRFGAPALAPTY